MPLLCVCFNFGFGERGRRGNQPSPDGTLFCNNRNQKMGTRGALTSCKLQGEPLGLHFEKQGNVQAKLSSPQAQKWKTLLSQWLAPKCCLIGSVNSTAAICIGTLESPGWLRYTARGDPGTSRLVICARAVDGGRPDMHWHRLWQHMVRTLIVHRARKASRG